MQTIHGFQTDVCISEELEMLKVDREVDELCLKIESLCHAHKVLMDEDSTDEAKQTVLAEVSALVSKEEAIELAFDQENYGSAGAGFELAGKIIMAIIKVLLELAETFARYMMKVISFTGQKFRESDRLQGEILKSLHTYADAAPVIKTTTVIEPVISREGQIIDPYGISRMFEQDLEKYDPTLVMQKIQSGLDGIIADIQLGSDNNVLKQSYADLSESIENVLRNTFKASFVKNAKVKTYVYGLGELPFLIRVMFKPGDPTPESELVVYERRPPRQVEGYKPTDAHVVASAAKKTFGRILDRDDGVKFKKAINEKVRILKDSKASSSSEHIELLPKWVKFARNYIKTVNNYEYRIAHAALEAVKQSKDNWSDSNA